jgi:hypothetical protein
MCDNKPVIPVRQVIEQWNSPANQARFSELLAMSQMPESHRELNALGINISNELLSFVAGRLSPEDRALWVHMDAQAAWPAASDNRVWRTFDYVVIERAESTYGPFVFLSPLVRMRYIQWFLDPEYGFRRITELHRAIERGNSVRLGKDKLPITEPEWRSTKSEGVAELRRIFKQYRYAFNRRRTTPTYRETCDWYRQTVLGSASFPFLSGNLDSLFNYIEYAESKGDNMKNRFTSGLLKPGEFFDNWGAYSRNLSPQNFRQSIANLPKL